MPIRYPRWEIALKGSASAMRNAKSRIKRGEYGVELDALVVYDRERDTYLLAVRTTRR